MYGNSSKQFMVSKLPPAACDSIAERSHTPCVAVGTFEVQKVPTIAQHTIVQGALYSLPIPVSEACLSVQGGLRNTVQWSRFIADTLG